MDWRERLSMWRVRWRTLAGAGVLAFVGLMHAIGEIDLRPLVSYFVSDDKAVGAIMTSVSLFFAGMRFVSDEPVFRQISAAEARGRVDQGS